MPCEIWKDLAFREKRNRKSYTHYAFNKDDPEVGERKRIRLMTEHQIAMVEASNAKFRHRQTCTTCSKEPYENFQDSDPWDKNPKSLGTPISS